MNDGRLRMILGDCGVLAVAFIWGATNVVIRDALGGLTPKPVLAPILAYFIIDEAISWSMALGIIFFLAGSLASVIPAMLRSKAPG